MFDGLIGGCFAILLATITLYCALQVFQYILPWLVALIGVAAIVWITVAILRFWMRNRY